MNNKLSDFNQLCVKDIGEKSLIREIISLLPIPPQLLDGFGHDRAFLNISIKDDEVLLLNTDRSGANIAWQLGLSDGSCVGDFGVSHAISDILVAGGTPLSLSIALLIPPNEKVQFIREVVIGSVKAANKYGAFIASGDTKHNPKFAMVVTALGKCLKSERLTRSGAKPGDLIVVTGPLGTMVTAQKAIREGIKLEPEIKAIFEEALIYQNPPYKLAHLINRSKIAHAAMDISDGLASSLYTMCEASHVGANIDVNLIPILAQVRQVANKIGMDAQKLAMASGDWRFLYAIPAKHIDLFMKLALSCQSSPSVIGQFVADPEQRVLARNGSNWDTLPRIENDRFKLGGTAFFQSLTKSNCIVKEIK